MGEQKTQDKINSIQNIFVSLGRIEQVKILEEITAAIAEHVKSENNNNDATDGIFDALDEIAEELVGILKNLSEFLTTNELL